ncbi:MAG: ribose 5-phosphate isomerase B [Bacillota bacterium]
MRIAIGCDHGGFELKQTVMKHLAQKQIECEDFGCYTSESVDYPDIAVPVAKAVLSGDFDLGILVCGTGVGISIAANKIKGIRCGLCSDTFTAHAVREHNDANILAMGGRVIGSGVAVDIVDAFLNAKFEGGRHQRRIDKMMALEG